MKIHYLNIRLNTFFESVECTGNFEDFVVFLIKITKKKQMRNRGHNEDKSKPQ